MGQAVMPRGTGVRCLRGMIRMMHSEVRATGSSRWIVIGPTSGNLPLTFLDSYERKSRKADEEPRIQKKLIPKCTFRRSEAPIFSKSRQVNGYFPDVEVLPVARACAAATPSLPC